MLWILLSLFFFWLLFREFRMRVVPRAGYDSPVSTPIYKPYAITVLALALFCAWTPFKYWRFERLLSRQATILADGQRADVHCNTVFDTFFDQNVFAAGHANWDTGEIVLQYPWCGRLMDYLDDPAKANASAAGEEVASLHLFTHESMHVRGERDEAATECQAIQRNYRAARLLGVPDAIARKTAWHYYEGAYQARAQQGSMSRAYYSEQCAPGKAMDERLPDSTWNSR